MIKLCKGPVPEVLSVNSAAWTAELLRYRDAGTTPPKRVKNRYGHPDIKAALVLETNAKCAYCESKFAHVTYGDIEHITAKKHDPEKTFNWENLTLACDICNTKKGSFGGTDHLLIDPYEDEPSEHIEFIGPMIFPKIGSEKGKLTDLILDLNRVNLIERRVERLRQLYKIVVEYASATRPEVRHALQQYLETVETADDKEFAALARYYVSAVLRTLREGGTLVEVSTLEGTALDSASN